MANFAHYLKDRSFDRELDHHQLMVHTQAALEAAQQAAYQEGYAAGEQAGREGQLGACRTILEQVAAQATAFLQDQATYWDPVHDQMSQGLRQALDLSLESAARHIPQELLTSFVTRLLEGLKTKTNLVVLVHPSMVAPLSAHLSDTGLAFVGDPALGPVDCRLDFETGGVERTMAWLQDQLDTVFATYHGTLAHPARLVVDEDLEDPQPSEQKPEQSPEQSPQPQGDPA